MADKTKIHFNKTPEEIIRERREREASPTDSLKRPRPPLGGAPPVRIPPLNAEPIEGGGTMDAQARTLQDPTSPLSPVYNPELAMMMTKQRQGPDKGPFATLPEEAREDPSFVPGVGSMIAANQPHLRRPETDGYRPALSDKSKAAIETLAAFQAQAQQVQTRTAEEPTEEDKKRQVDASNLGKVVAKTEENLYEELKDILGDGPQFNLLNNPERKKTIEGRLAPMSITDIIVYGEVRQNVVVVPDKLVVAYRSVSAEEDLAIKQMMFGEAGGDRYLMDKYTIMQLTLALVSINGDELPTHLDDKKKFKEDLFRKKFEKVVRFPIQWIADLGIQYLWFDERVRKLFVGQTEELKNT